MKFCTMSNAMPQHRLERSFAEKYLRVPMDSKLNMSKQCNLVAKKVQRNAAHRLREVILLL